MSHFLGARLRAPWEVGSRSLTQFTSRRPYAAVKVELVRMRPKIVLRVVPGSICLLRDGSALVRLPDSVVVTDPADEEGEEPLRASGEFYVTAETIDPYHLLIDAMAGNRPF